MNATRRSKLAAALAGLALALPSLAVLGQASAPPLALPDLPNSASTRAASASASGPRGPRLRGPAETGNRAAAPGDLHPERPVTPQISIPFGKTPPPPTRREERVVRRGSGAASTGVDEAAARCESQTDEQARASCRAGLAREAKGRLPN